MQIIQMPMLTQHLIGFAQERFNRFTRTSFPDLFSGSDDFLGVPERFITLLAEHRDEIRHLVGTWLIEMDKGLHKHEVIELFSYHTRRYIKNNNQFLRLSQNNQHDLAGVYRRFLRSFHLVVLGSDGSSLAEHMVDLLEDHREHLRSFIRSLDLGGDQIAERHGPHCSEYSPALQTEILRLDPASIFGPLLDLGCGEQANLVRYLRGHGVESYGIDRFAPENEPGVYRGDWLEETLGRERWGTVISHMAFSHHFLHHHLKGSDAIRDYALRYMAILAALKPGGSFIYSPGLPFIEELLPADRYQVETSMLALATARGTEGDAAITARLGTSTFYSTRVTALARTGNGI